MPSICSDRGHAWQRDSKEAGSAGPSTVPQNFKCGRGCGATRRDTWKDGAWSREVTEPKAAAPKPPLPPAPAPALPPDPTELGRPEERRPGTNPPPVTA